MESGHKAKGDAVRGDDDVISCSIVEFGGNMSSEDLFLAYVEREEHGVEADVDDQPRQQEAFKSETYSCGSKRPSPEDEGEMRPTKSQRLICNSNVLNSTTSSPPDDLETPMAAGVPMSKKQRKRAAKAEQRWQFYGHLPRPTTRRLYVRGASAMTTPLKIHKLPCKFGGYTAKAQQASDRTKEYALEDLLRMGMALVPFKGYDTPIQDKGGRVLAVRIPPPTDPSYQHCHKGAFATMMQQGEAAQARVKDLTHKRGSGFLAVNGGLTYGNGHTTPSIPKHGSYQGLVDSLISDSNFQRLASFQDAAFALWHPEGYKYYKSELDKLWAHHAHLRPNFRRSILPTVAFNIGRNVWTHKHVDSQNCPYGWCCVTALGDFDYTKGGHIILWELGLVVEFPAGSCVCIPSALITHSNIPVQSGDSRASFTQYCPGEIFRYIENGFCTDAELKRTNPRKLEANVEACKRRLREGFQKFSTLSSLQAVGIRFSAF